MCARWRVSFEAFLSDMGRKPSPKHSIDRIDNDGNYEPANCRWTDWTTQQRNRSSNRMLTAFGWIASVAEWAELVGVSPFMIYRRLRLGWSHERAIFSKPHFRGVKRCAQ